MRVLGHFDIGQQLDFFTIECDCGGIEQAREAAALEFDLALFEAVFGQDDGRGIDDHHAGIAVNNDPIVLAHQLTADARTHYRRNIHAARDDGGVRGLAADIGDKTGKHALLELQHISRRQIVRHQDQRHIHGVAKHQVLRRVFRGAARRHRHRVGHTAHSAQYALRNLL